MLRSPLLRNVRKRLRMIEYYSATRPRNGWTRALDASLFITLILAFPITWICDAMVIRPVQVIEYSGILTQSEGGEIAAAVGDLAKRKANDPSSAILNVPIGLFRTELVDHHHGWPLTTTVRRQPTRVHLDLRIEPAPRQNVLLAEDDPLRRAIADALRVEGHDELLRAWPAPHEMPADQAGVEVHRHGIAWLIAAGVWWLMMVLATGVTIHLLKFGATLFFAKRHARRARLRAEGKCHACGYDMTGLEFNERCPECGELVW